MNTPSKIEMIKEVRSFLYRTTGHTPGLANTKHMVDKMWPDVEAWYKGVSEVPVVNNIYLHVPTNEYVTVLYVDMVSRTALVRYNAYNENPFVVYFNTLTGV